MSTSPLQVNCPTCNAAVEWKTENEHRPFCCERCKLIDLGAWANEEYAIPAPPEEQWSEDPQSNHSLGPDTLQ